MKGIVTLAEFGPNLSLHRLISLQRFQWLTRLDQKSKTACKRQRDNALKYTGGMRSRWIKRELHE